MSKTAGIVIIGNEVLSGKTQDMNSYFLCRELRTLGVEVQRILVIPDEIQLIGKEIVPFSRQWDLVFTTGGVGPTHDDVTMAGIAHGFGVKLIRHYDLERRLHERHGENINQARLKMAEVPEGAELIGEGSLYAPVVRFHNVYIFPGIPKILHERFHVIKERFRNTPFFLKIVYVKEGEGVIALTLNNLLVSFPNLLLGSYPVLGDPSFKVKVTLESKDENYLDQALKKLLDTLPRGAIHQIERK